MFDLRQMYRVLDYSYNNRDRKPGESICIMIVPPSELVEHIPMSGKASEDGSPHHVTVLYLGNLPVELERKVKLITEHVISQTRPFTVSFGRPGKFSNEEHDVYHATIRGKKLHMLRDNLKNAFAANQIMSDSKHPNFQPHMTLEYVQPGEKKTIAAYPTGKFRVEHCWLLGFQEPHLIFFKGQ